VRKKRKRDEKIKTYKLLNLLFIIISVGKNVNIELIIMKKSVNISNCKKNMKEIIVA
jgi:hypothetical protein